MEHFNQNDKYYTCSFCQNHIVLERDFVQRNYRNGLFTGGCFFENVKNVYNVDLRNDDRVQRVHCVFCHTALGFRYVRVPAAQLCFLVQNGRYKIKMQVLHEDRVSYWNTNQVLNGYSEVLPEPIPTPEPVFHLVPEPFLPSRYIDQLQAVVGNFPVLAPQPQPPEPPQGNGDEPPALCPVEDADDEELPDA